MRYFTSRRDHRHHRVLAQKHAYVQPPRHSAANTPSHTSKLSISTQPGAVNGVTVAPVHVPAVNGVSAASPAKSPSPPLPRAVLRALWLTVMLTALALVVMSASAVYTMLWGESRTLAVVTPLVVSFISVLVVHLDIRALVESAGMLSGPQVKALLRPSSAAHRSRGSAGVSAPTQPAEPAREAPSVSRRPSPRGPASQGEAWLRCMASAAEVEAVVATKQMLKQSPPEGMPADGPLLDVQVLRFVREHGTSARTVDRRFRKALAWKLKSLPELQAQVEQSSSRWLAAAEMPHGDWATSYAPIGMHCGYSLSGHPVKVERIGAYDLAGLQRSPDCRRRLNAFYLGLVDCLQRRLDLTSVEQKSLQQTYEIFDLAGLGPHMLTMTTIAFTKDVLLAFSTHYPSSFAKAVIINAPSFVGGAWSLVSVALPKSVKAKVKMLGTDYEGELANDLTQEALSWVRSANEQLIHAPHRSTDARLPSEDEARGGGADAAQTDDASAPHESGGAALNGSAHGKEGDARNASKRASRAPEATERGKGAEAPKDKNGVNGGCPLGLRNGNGGLSHCFQSR